MTNSSEQEYDPESNAESVKRFDSLADPIDGQRPTFAPTGVSIGAIAQEIGLTKDTLRV